MAETLDPIFRPRSVAVVGASRRPQTIGREILHNLIEYGFTGAVYPVNPQSPSVHSITSYARLRDVPEPVDLAIVVVPRPAVPKVIDDAIARRVKGLVVITAGYREVGGDGVEAEKTLRARVRAAGIRMIGPNCMGVINTDPAVRLNATFAATQPEEGAVGFMSQSGALGEVILAHARDIGLGIAYFASMGNKADISGNDLIEAWENDPRVRVILMYLESFGNPAKFASITRRVTRVKPILAVKAGRTAAGARAAFSHTGALAGSENAVDTLFEQCGVLRASSMSEMFTLATALANQPLPAGNRVAIVTNAGGPAIMATDACATLGLDIVELPRATQDRLRRVLVPEASVRNPVDMIASADASRYAAVISILKKERSIDGLIVLFVSPVMINAIEVARAIVEASRGADKPILTCFMGTERGREGVAMLRRAGVPVYLFPEEAAQAMAGLDRYRRIRERPQGRVPALRVDAARARRLLRTAAAAGRTQLSDEETAGLLRAYGFPVAASRTASGTAAAIEAASEIGYPVVVKAVAAGLVHKSERGAVRVDLRNADEVVGACRDIDRALGGQAHALQVQRMVTGGHETILGLALDPQFGHLVMFGLGGIYVEVMKDVVFRRAPITDVEARDMVHGIRGYPLLAGVRGQPPADEEFLARSLLRLSRMAVDCPEIEQLDINPLIVGPDGASSFVVDARVRLVAALTPARRVANNAGTRSGRARRRRAGGRG